MLIGGDDISYYFITLGTCFSMFVYIRASFCFTLMAEQLCFFVLSGLKKLGSHQPVLFFIPQYTTDNVFCNYKIAKINAMP